MDVKPKTEILYRPDADAVNVLLETGETEGAGQTDITAQHDREEDCGHDGDDESGGEERHTWSSKREYLLSAIGYTVGIGNVWRFPYLCNRNGGGAFLIPFLLCLLLFGLPLNFLEMSLGQFTGKSPLHVWSVCPLVKGIGVSHFILSVTVYWYYNTILAWTLYFLVSCFQSVLPWSLCGQWWNTPNCKGHSTIETMVSPNATSPSLNVTNAANDPVQSSPAWTNSSVGSFDPWNSEVGDEWNATNGDISTTNGSLLKPVTAAEEFWQHNVLRVSSGLYDMGHVVWPLVLTEFVVVLLLFLALFKGIKSSGKVVYVTATAPYLLLTVLLIRGATLPGAKEGILYYITPNFSRILDSKVWVEAALQIFYSLCLAWGPVITLASYNKFQNNCFRDAVLVSLVGEGTSVFGGFAIFAVLGYMAQVSGVPVDQVVSSGPGLAFIVYPEALSLLPLPHLWAVLFFVMLVTAVADSQMATGETVLTILCDHFPRFLGRHRLLLNAGMALVMLVCSLPLITQGGVYIFQLVDWFIGSYTVTVIALSECVVMAWIYGRDRFGWDIEMMTGQPPPKLIKILWAFVVPALLVVLLVFTLAKYEAPTYGDYHYDTLATVIGWTIASISFIPIPVVAGWMLYRARGSLMQRLRQTTTPSRDWGPADPARRRSYQKCASELSQRHGWRDIISN